MGFKKHVLLGLIAAISTVSAATIGNYSLKWNGQIKMSRPAFVELEKHNDDFRMIVSSFKVFGKDSVYKLDNVGSYKGRFSSAKPEVWISSKSLVWPNGVEEVPESVMGPGFYSVAGGFLVPGKGDGAVSIVDCNAAEKQNQHLWPELDNSARVFSDKHITRITPRKKGWWYHRVRWNDMDGDGDLDLLTARAIKPMIGKAKGEMIWYENDKGQNKWKEHFLMAGPDVHFELYDFDGDGKNEIIATEFWAKRLSVLWATDNKWERRVIDAEFGAGFDLAITDVNNDGKLDILATNHENKAEDAAVFAYEIPEDFKTAEFAKHILLTDIPTLNSGVGQASPGVALTFHPEVNIKGKPWIIASGDGSQRAHLLVPVSEDKNNWEYKEHVIFDAKCTVGQIAVEDIDGDGFVELFVPAYDKDSIEVFTFGR